jgi:hypothetical protein
MIRRVERLERAISRPTEEVPPMEITNVFIAPDGEVVSSFVITIPPTRLHPMASTEHKSCEV